MDRKFLSEQMKRLEANYGTERFKITKQMFDIWYEMFSNCAEEGIRSSVNEYIRENEYPPTIAGIMKIYREKERFRKEVIDYVLGNYTYISHWCNEYPNQRTCDLFKKKCFCTSLKEAKHNTDILMEKIMNYYNKIENRENSMKLYDFLEGME